jgi:hypothetical protein
MNRLTPPATPERREIHIFGGPTAESKNENPLSAKVASRIGELTQVFLPGLDTRMHLTDQAGGELGIETDEDLYKAAHEVAAHYPTKMVYWLPDSPSQQEIASMFRRESVDGMAPRKDIFLIGMTATKGAAGTDQFDKGLNFVKNASANLALTHDYGSQNSMVVAPEESRYEESTELDVTLQGLLEMSYLRSQLTFTRSTVIDGKPVDWKAPEVYTTLRDVVNFCIEKGAYKPFLGVTAGHFACKVGDNEFLTSRRKTNFNNLPTTGLVKVVTDGPDQVVAMGGKPSVGGQSQRIVFENHPERDSIVHFHCPPKPGSKVPVVSQREYECGSHECGQNTSEGLALVDDGIEAVMLDNHGPNIVFHHEEDPEKIKEFIQDNFDLTKKTGGYALTAAG